MSQIISTVRSIFFVLQACRDSDSQGVGGDDLAGLEESGQRESKEWRRLPPWIGERIVLQMVVRRE